MAGAEITVNVYGVKNVVETLQIAARLIDEFNAIPQAQLMLIIDAARDRLPEMAAQLDLWLDHLDDVAEAMSQLKANQQTTETVA